MTPHFRASFGLALLLFLAVGAGAQGSGDPAPAPQDQLVDLSRAVVVVSRGAGPVERQAARMLVEESARRSGVTLPVREGLPARDAQQPLILLGTLERRPPSVAPDVVARVPRSPAGKPAEESYALVVDPRRRGPVVSVLGADARGCMFGTGRLLRELRFSAGRIEAPLLVTSTAPAQRLRGHQLGWRPVSNTYDRWGLKEYEQYLRDLVVWGTNAIELIPEEPGTDSARNIEFNARLANLIHSYGLQVWLWYPMDDRVPPGLQGDGLTAGQNACPSRVAGRRFILDRRRELFRRIKHIDAVFIPGGDPGGCECERCQPWERTLLPLAEEVSTLLRKSHPGAQVWLSNQGFDAPENRHFYGWLQSEQPRWLTGLVYAPWAHETPASMRARTPARYPIRFYPDITHTVRCQFPSRDWDQAFALTLDREPPIYRAAEHAQIARLYQPLTCGALTYSDGVNDDLNKVIWSARLWDPQVEVNSVLRGYSRYYLGQAYTEDGADGLRMLERNGAGSLRENASVRNTFEHWKQLEQGASPELRSNWRFAMALLRAYYDRYVQLRLAHDTALERAAYQALEAGDSQAAITRALGLLDEEPFRELQLRARLLDLGQLLHDRIGMQLSVSRWGASGEERGAILDHLDRPLSNVEWLRAELLRLRAAGPQERAEGIRRVLHWEDPGPGGFYDDLGNPSRQPHLVRAKGWEEDPGYLESPRTDFRIPLRNGRQSWNNYAEALYDQPITLRYERLDPQAEYVVRATYSGRYRPTMTLTANGTYPVHGAVATQEPPETREWPIPRAATAGGNLTLTWKCLSGRGAQVSEVWLIRTSH